MSEIKFGSLIDTTDDVKRDATHVAVAPVIAYEDLQPGQRINFRRYSGPQVVGATTEAIGIVDPFLDAPVKSGERFWMVLLPHTVKNLRHHWDHPSFSDDDTRDVEYHDGCSGC